MAKQSPPPKTTHFSQTLDGFPPNTVGVDKSIITMICPTCKAIFKTSTPQAKRLWTTRGVERSCSRSCGRALTYVNNPGLRQIVSQSMTETFTGKPSWNKGRSWPADFRQASSQRAKLRGAGWTSSQRGGNGRGPTPSEKLLGTVLPGEFIYNYAISLGRRQPGFPTNYKVDFGNPQTKIAIEVDGGSHYGRRSQDAKKETKLAELGWLVLRISNATVSRMFGTWRSEKQRGSTRTGC